MRKLKLQVQMTIDGFIAGENGEMGFMTWNWDDKLNSYVDKITENIDCIILGRKLAEGFIPYWNDVAQNPDHQEFTAGKKFSDTKKIIFTRTLEKSLWDNTVLAKGDLKDEISELKNQSGNDIIVYGGAEFVSSLIKEDLIDEYNLLINPSAIGSGMAIFNKLDKIMNLKFISAKGFECGIVALRYEK